MLRSSRAALLVTLVAFALALAACGSSSTTPAPTTAPAASTPASAPSPEASTGGGGGAGNAVTIQNFSFGPATLDVAVGTTVTWTNKDSTNHTVTANDGSFDSKAISPGATFTQTFATAGTFAYHCSIHSTMTATITVK
jgi:plastocyanin